MAARDLLRILFEDLKISGTAVDVIPVITTDMEADRSLLKELFLGLGGHLIELHELGASGAVGDLESNPKAAARARELMDGLARSGEEFVLNQDGGLVRASFSGSQLQNLSAQTVNGAALVPFDARLLASEVAAVTWSDPPLDVDRRRAVWRLLTGLDGERLGDLQRLFLFIDGPLDMEVHLAGETPARHWISSGNLHHFKRPVSMRAWTRILAARHASREPIVYFLGAGFSCTSGTDKDRRLPLGDSLRDHALIAMLGTEGTDDERAAELYHLVADNDLWTPMERVGDLPSIKTFTERLTLERVLLVQFALNDGLRTNNETLRLIDERNALVTTQPSVGVRRLHDLLRTGHPAILLTVNFDTLVESGTDLHLTKLATPAELGLCDEVIAEYLASTAVPGSVERPIPYVKLHGTIEDFGSIVADVGSVAGGFDRSVHDGLERLAANESDPIPWIYLGHSMRDLDLEPIVASKRFAVGTREIWVDPILPAPVERFAARNRDPVWEGLSRPTFGLRHVTSTADLFFAELWRCISGDP